MAVDMCVHVCMCACVRACLHVCVDSFQKTCDFLSAICGCNMPTRNQQGWLSAPSKPRPTSKYRSVHSNNHQRVVGISDDPWLWMERCLHHFRTITGTRTRGVVVQQLHSTRQSVTFILVKLASSHIHIQQSFQGETRAGQKEPNTIYRWSWQTWSHRHSKTLELLR